MRDAIVWSTAWTTSKQRNQIGLMPIRAIARSSQRRLKPVALGTVQIQVDSIVLL
jgi:hypothetical protein